MDPILQLKGQSPLTQGRSRLVFEHPDDPDLLVKVIRPEVVEDRYGGNTKWYKKRRRFGKFISYIREVQEFIAVSETSEDSDPLLQRIVGFARTDMGLGLVIVAVKSADGNLAPPLAQLIRENTFDADARKALDFTLEGLLKSNVIISDLNLGNLVYVEKKNKPSYFVLIDGIGNNALLPFKAMSQTMNRRSKLKRFERLRRRIIRAEHEYQQK